jgi:hypothetical protein
MAKHMPQASATIDVRRSERVCIESGRVGKAASPDGTARSVAKKADPYHD